MSIACVECSILNSMSLLVENMCTMLITCRAAPSSANRNGSAHSAARKASRPHRHKPSLSRRVAELEDDDDDEEEEEEAAAVEAQMAAELGSDDEAGSKRAPRVSASNHVATACCQWSLPKFAAAMASTAAGSGWAVLVAAYTHWMRAV